MILQFLDSLPQTFADTADVQCATGTAMQVAHKLTVRQILSVFSINIIVLLKSLYFILI